MRMNLKPLPLKDAYLIDSEPFKDHRGWFYRAFCSRELSELLGGRQIMQINISRTETVGAIRGLHFQYPPQAEMKLIRCLRGAVWDVALDLREGSPTFLRWHAETLSVENARMIVIPEGCAHGFQVLEPGSELLYLHTAVYEPTSEGGLRFNDPAVQIAWPLAPADISERDDSHPLIQSDFRGIPL